MSVSVVTDDGKSRNTCCAHGIVQRLSNKPKRKSGIISSFGKLAKGAEGARAFQKTNEENIMSHRRCVFSGKAVHMYRL
jgi:hypothetical protein